MKNIILFIAIMASVTLSAQTTFDLDWAVGINGEAASLTIETGDTVRWTWTDGIPHSVTNKAGSQEAFDSGILTGIGEQFSYTFTEEGTNDYQCDVHPGTMFGTITVETGLSTEDKFIKNIKLYPNPVNDKLTLTSLMEIDSFKLYNTLGNLVYENFDSNHIVEYSMSHLPSGIYFLVLTSNNLKKTIKIIKK